MFNLSDSLMKQYFHNNSWYSSFICPHRTKEFGCIPISTIFFMGLYFLLFSIYFQRPFPFTINQTANIWHYINLQVKAAGLEPHSSNFPAKKILTRLLLVVIGKRPNKFKVSMNQIIVLVPSLHC